MILKTPWVRVWYDTNADYYHASRGDVVMIAAMTTDNKIIMIHQYKEGPHHAVWQLPAGHINAGEPYVDAAARELHEEVGLRGEDWEEFGDWYIDTSWRRDKVRVYTCRVSLPAKFVPSEAISSVGGIPIGDAGWMVRRGQVLDPHSCIAILLLETELLYKWRTNEDI